MASLRISAAGFMIAAALFAMTASLTGCDGGGGGATANGAGQGGAIDLRPNLTSTDVLTYEHTLEISESRTSAPGTPVTSLAQVVRIYTLQSVAQEPDGGALVELIIQRVLLALRTPEGRMVNIDTDSPAMGVEDPQTQTVRKLAGFRIILAVNPNGSVREIRGLEQAMSAIGGLPQGMGAFFSEDWFRAAVEGAYRAREDATTAALGDEWVVTKDGTFADVPNASHTTFTSRLSGVHDQIATIEGSAVLALDFDRIGMLDPAASQIDDQLFEFSKRWDLTRGNLLEHTTIQRAQISLLYGGLQVKVDQGTGSRLARLSPDGVPSSLIERESGGTDMDGEASETENPASEHMQ